MAQSRRFPQWHPHAKGLGKVPRYHPRPQTRHEKTHLWFRQKRVPQSETSLQNKTLPSSERPSTGHSSTGALQNGLWNRSPDGSAKSHLGPLKTTLSAAARMVTGIKKFDHISPALKELKWLPIEQRANLRTACLTHKALHTGKPEYLAAKLKRAGQSRNLRSSNTFLLISLKSRKRKTTSKSFAGNAPKIWNSIPPTLERPPISRNSRRYSKPSPLSAPELNGKNIAPSGGPNDLYGDLTKVQVFGKWHNIPRKQVTYGDVGLTYTYSGVTLPPKPWIPILDCIRNRITEATGHRFNFVLINRYKDGNDHMGEHRDDEKELVPRSPIASVSLGACRDFFFRHGASRGKKSTMHIEPVKLQLEHGSLLMMNYPTNVHWYHSLPARKKILAPRINLTFRKIICVK
ncbi:DNA oxidative demethylase ALKBH2 isoform X1 [Lissotriton helveticus]